MRNQDKIQKLRELPVFDLKTLRATLGISYGYSKIFARRLEKRGVIFRIERDRYTFHNDLFLVASNMVWPSYISLWSALRYHNLTEQVPHSVWVVTTRKKYNKRVRFGGNEIIFLFTKPRYFFGFKKTDYRGSSIFIAEPEKAIVDALLFKRISFHEIFSIVRQNIKRLNARRLLNFAVETNNKALIKRAGFALESAGYDCYNSVKRHIQRTFVPLDYALPKKGRKNEKWKVIENVVL